MKKLNHISVFLMVLIFISTFINPTQVSAEVQNDFENTSVNFLKTYFLTRDNVDANYISPKYENVNIENYINNRIDIESSVKKAAHIIKFDYKITATLINKENRDSLDYLTYGVRRDFTYEGIDSPTVVSDEVVVIGSKNIIVDVLFPNDPIEKELRGTSEKINLSKSQRLDSLDVDSINFRAKEYKERLLKSIEAAQVVEKDVYGIEGSTSLDPISSSKSLTWAKANYNKYSPLSSSSIVPYYDFSKISGSYDCTNFVSHALLAVGANLFNNGNPSTGWWYASLNSRSYSWPSVNYLFSFLTTTHSKGPVASSVQYKIFDERYEYPFSLGDIVQFGNTSAWGHSTIIMGFYVYNPASPYRYGTLVIGRTSPTQYNFNFKVEDSNYDNKRVLVVEGTY